MAHFAELDENNVVLRVVVVHNNDAPDEDTGRKFLTDLYGVSRWVQTSYNGNMRKNFAGIGYTYDETRDALIPPKPFSSWILDEQKCRWESPVDRPNGNPKVVYWDEPTLSWKEIV